MPIDTSSKRVVICPYCGTPQPLEERCRRCNGRFDILSRRASHNEMGPWFIRDERRPFQPGCSYETMVRLLEAGRLDAKSVVRGPTTKQFWTVVMRTPGLAHLVGRCHECGTHVDPIAHHCPSCREPFGAYLDRNHLGLPDVEPLPGEAPGASGVAPPAWDPGPLAPRSMSAFVTDDELLEGSASDYGAVAPDDGNGNGTEAAAPVTTADRATIHALRKRVRASEKRSRWLVAACIVLGVAAAIFAAL